MRVTGKTAAEKQKVKSGNYYKGIHWPDMVFGPVNLWCLPPASFFYRRVSGKDKHVHRYTQINADEFITASETL